MTADADRISVLFVDDDRDFLELASHLLSTEGDRIELVTESDPTAVPDRLREAEIDCVVSDYRMAEMDGIELLEAVREDHPTLPFVVFTAQGDEAVASEAIAAGGTDYVVNTGAPEQYAVLANRIETVVGRRRSERLATQHRRLDSIYRSVTRELADQPTKERIEAAVCEALVGFEGYAAAWIGDVTPSDEIDVRAASDDALAALSGATGPLPETDAIAEGTVRTVDDARDAFPEGDPHPLTEAVPLRSLVTVPLAARGISYGGLTVYGDVPELFGDREAGMLADLGDMIGFALSAAEQRQGVLSYSVNELELTVSDPDAALIDLAGELETTVRLEGTIPRPDGSFVLFLAFDAAVPDADASAALEGAFADADPERTAADPHRWTVVSPSWFGEQFTHHGVQVTEVIATPSSARIRLECPLSVPVRDVIDLAEFQFAGVELTTKRKRSRVETPSAGAGSALADLTSRQREVLETAYRSGFFDWPRKATAEEVAATLDISQPAFSQHIRRAEQQVFARLFEGESEPGRSEPASAR